MRKVALLAAALGAAAAGLLGTSGNRSADRVAQQIQKHVEHQQDRQRAPVAPGDYKAGLRSGGTTGGWRMPGVGGYRKKPRGSHKQNARVEAKRLRRQRGGAGTELLATIAAGALIVGLFLLVYAPLASMKCNSKWEGSGLRTEYGLFSGCRVQTADGRWLPEDRVREIDVAKPAEPRQEIPR